jgi:metallophosphoesterase (TIGR00282 family)
MVLLAVGDVCGEPGIAVCERHLRSLRRMRGVDCCVVNGENADVLGIRPEQARRLYDAGADFVTLGNHAWHRRQIAGVMDDSPYILRPLNFNPALPGHGTGIYVLNSGRKLCVVSLIGRLDCAWNADSPFTALDRLLDKREADCYVVDFHAEATSEKAALAYYADGRVSAVFGTHTHVQTSDERVLPKGTGFITDLGMCGAIESILGIKIEQSINHFLGGLPQHYEAPPSDAKIEGALFEIDEPSGKCVNAERIRLT